MIKEKLSPIIYQAIGRAHAAGQIDLPLSYLEKARLVFDRPHLPEHGDLSCPVAMQLASASGSPAAALNWASNIVLQIIDMPKSEDLLKAPRAVAPGFINFDLGHWLAAEIVLEAVRLGPYYGLVKEHGRIVAARAEGRKGAQKQSILRPVRQAYERCGLTLRQAIEPRINILSGGIEEPLFSPEDWDDFIETSKIKIEMYLGLDLFQDASETRNRDLCRAQTRLILKLESFPAEVEIFSASGSGDRLTRFSLELADDLSDFWRRFNLGEGFFNAQLSVLKARLGLILATRQVLGNALGIIDLPVLEQM